LHSFETDKQQILLHLENFEHFCLGKKYLSPGEVQSLNEELSIGAIVHIGKYKLQKKGEDVYVVWRSPDGGEHDLGPIDKLNVMRDCPGFHRSRSLALGHDYVETSGQVTASDGHSQVSVVKMKDGSTGYGPNYKVALRNAALKMHLKGAFERANPSGLWKMIYGNA
ncbi:MAG: hypothetical protein WBK77_02805, partial [Alphaproteobacteria bacterium]